MFAGRVVAPGEALWLDEDRADALALQLEEAGECPGCGWPLDETTDPDTEDRWLTSIVRCHRCTARDDAASVHADQPRVKPGFLVRTHLHGPRPAPKV